VRIVKILPEPIEIDLVMASPSKKSVLQITVILIAKKLVLMELVWIALLALSLQKTTLAVLAEVTNKLHA